MANPIVITNLIGRNGGDPITEIQPDQAVEMLNVDLDGCGLAHKKTGTASVALTDSTLTTTVLGLIPTPFQFGTNTQTLFAFSASVCAKRTASPATWTVPTIKDAVAIGDAGTIAHAHRPNGVWFNNKLFLTYQDNTTQGTVTADRLEVWDGTSIRRVGVGTPAKPTVANSAGAGTYAAVARFYKVAYTVQVSGVTVRRSELSPASDSFTPDGSHDAAVVTKPAAISEGETHWELYGCATATGSYVLLATTAVATTTVNDTTVPTSYTGTAAPLAGTNNVPLRVRFIVATDSRLLLFGSLDDPGGVLDCRYYWTPVLGSSDIGDDERVPDTTSQTNYESVEHPITAAAGPALGGIIYMWSHDRMWKLIPTGDVSAPYIRTTVSYQVGCIDNRSVVFATDEFGAPAVYWASARGFYRYGSNGLEYIGRDIEDIWTGTTQTVNASVHGVYYEAKRQIWWWTAKTVGETTTYTKLILSIRHIRRENRVRGGWTIDRGASANATASCIFGGVPWIARGDVAEIHQCDSGTTDGATAYQAYVLSRPFTPVGLNTHMSVGEPRVLADASSGVTLTITNTHDWGTETRTGTVLLTAAGTETRVCPKPEGLLAQGLTALQVQIGDASAAAAAWTVHAISLPVDDQEPT